MPFSISRKMIHLKFTKQYDNYLDLEKIKFKFFLKIKLKKFGQIEEEQRQRDEMKQHYYTAEKRVQILEAEKDEISQTLEQAERARKQAELEASESRDQANELNMQVSNLNAAKRKAEGELQVSSSNNLFYKVIEITSLIIN